MLALVVVDVGVSNYALVMVVKSNRLNPQGGGLVWILADWRRIDHFCNTLKITGEPMLGGGVNPIPNYATMAVGNDAPSH